MQWDKVVKLSCMSDMRVLVVLVKMQHIHGKTWDKFQELWNFWWKIDGFMRFSWLTCSEDNDSFGSLIIYVGDLFYRNGSEIKVYVHLAMRLHHKISSIWSKTHISTFIVHWMGSELTFDAGELIKDVLREMKNKLTCIHWVYWEALIFQHLWLKLSS